MSSDSGAESTTASNGAAEKPQIERFHLPTPEEIRGQDIWNNCAVRSVVSGVMGIILIFPIFHVCSFSLDFMSFGILGLFNFFSISVFFRSLENGRVFVLLMVVHTRCLTKFLNQICQFHVVPFW